ncbi:MAG: hypothetical protein DI551_02865 [Micavibrio aeruginosavorus]|uniref:Protein kinase domain-containing protein n=1 Tax=Micavibrio aeruginosavorus TaxID=349221 RepID=A0A2W5N2I4_9BACT|nr:MAG: hypothetical protein DI551_02865 [Micavibrio aeruginosavorus]
MSDVTVQNEPEDKANIAANAEAPPPPSAAPPTGKQMLSGDVIFNDSITIYSGNRLPQYDNGPIKAYSARGVDRAPPSLVAYICEDHLIPRADKAPAYSSIANSALPPIIATGPVHWAPEGREKYCFIYENKFGNVVMPNDTRGGMGLKPDYMMNAVIRPMVNALADLRDKGIVHGRIRPSNLYDGGEKVFERVLLGDCLTLPVAYNQSVLYLPIERALASPIGRGTGTFADDLYAFGVTLAMMLRHHDPMEGLDDNEIIERKLDEGTYMALLGRDRFSGAVLELLRGLLQDDAEDRWTIDGVLLWMDGRRLSPKQAMRRPKANRPLLFKGEKYLRPELLARDLSKDMAEARTIVENGEMEQWMVRALDDKAAVARLESAVSEAEEAGKGAGYNEKLATRVAIALHPEGPIRYKSINLFPEAVGAALTEAFIMKRDLQTYIDFFMSYFVTQWIDAQPNGVTDVGTLISSFDGARAFLRQKGLGTGLERCIYSLCPETPCLSEKLSKYYVRTPEDMLNAFEKLSYLPSRPAMFFDRHSVAYLLVKDRKNIDPYMHDLNALESYRRILAEMKIVATIQKRSQLGRFPGIAKWISDNLEPIYERFHDRELRIELKKKVERLVDSGDLPKLIGLFDDPSVYQEDNAEFRRAMRKHHDLEVEVHDIERDLQNEENYGKEEGSQAAALVSAVLAMLIILVLAFTSFNPGGL